MRDVNMKRNRANKTQQNYPAQPNDALREQYPARPPHREDTLYLPWWSLLVMIGVVLVVATGMLLIVLGARGAGMSAIPSEPEMRLITAEPTLLQQPASLLSPTDIPGQRIIVTPQAAGPLALAGPTLPVVVFTATPISLDVGRTVRVIGVDAQELNVRDNPGVRDTTVLFRAGEDDRFVIIDGPQQADGLIWWQIRDPQNAGRTGWATAQYLQVIPPDNS